MFPSDHILYILFPYNFYRTVDLFSVYILLLRFGGLGGLHYHQSSHRIVSYILATLGSHLPHIYIPLLHNSSLYAHTYILSLKADIGVGPIMLSL